MIVGGITYDWGDALIITLEQAKHNLRIDSAFTEDDAEIQLFIYSAYQDVEAYLNRVLISQEKEFLLNESGDEITFELSQPEAFNTVNPIVAVATDGTKHTSTGQTVTFDGYKVTISDITYSTSFDVSSYIMTIDYLPNLLNDVINQAVYLTITNFYENRGSVVVGTIARELPRGADHIIRKFKYQLV